MYPADVLDDKMLRIIKIVVEVHDDVRNAPNLDWRIYRVHCHRRRALSYYRVVVQRLSSAGISCTRLIVDAVWAELKRIQEAAIAADLKGVSPKIPPLTGHTRSHR